MKIFSIRRGFQADHSSTSYEFLAVDKPLDAAARKAVTRLSSRAHPTKRSVSFIYHGDFSDLPGGWEPLARKYYDVMYTESYDWWTLAIAFNAGKKAVKEIEKYAFVGCEDSGVNVKTHKERVIIAIYCRIGANICDLEDPHKYDDDKSNDELLNLLVKNRMYLKKGDYRLLYGVWKIYGVDSETVVPEPSGMKKLPKPINALLSLFETM